MGLGCFQVGGCVGLVCSQCGDVICVGSSFSGCGQDWGISLENLEKVACVSIYSMY